MIRLSFLILLTASALGLFAARPVSINHFEIEGNVAQKTASSFAPTGMWFSGKYVLRAGQQTLSLIATEDTEAVVHVIAYNDAAERRDFMAPVAGHVETLLDLSDLGDKTNLVISSSQAFAAIAGSGHALDFLDIDVISLDNSDVALEALTMKFPIYWKVQDFTTLTCTTPAACGNLQFVSPGTLEERHDSYESMSTPYPDGYRLTWGCHTGEGDHSHSPWSDVQAPSYVLTSSTCGCTGTAVWTIYQSRVIEVTSKCSSDTQYSVYRVD